MSFFYENLQIEPRLIEKILSSRDSGPIEFTSERAEEEKLTRVKFAYSKRIFSCYFQKILKKKIKVAQICSNEFCPRKSQDLISMTIESFFLDFRDKEIFLIE